MGALAVDAGGRRGCLVHPPVFAGGPPLAVVADLRFASADAGAQLCARAQFLFPRNHQLATYATAGRADFAPAWRVASLGDSLPLSFLLIILFAIDAAHTASK